MVVATMRAVPDSVLNAKRVPDSALTDRFINMFWSHIEVDGDCWNWSGTVNAGGYGILAVPHERYNFLAHRVSYAIINGDPPAGKVIDHLCFNRRCVNPDHLRVLDHYVNMFRRDPSKARTMAETCVHGHPVNDENTYISPTGQRNCRPCNREAKRKWLRRRVWNGRRYILPTEQVSDDR